MSTSLLLDYASIIALDDILDGDQRYTTEGLTSDALVNLSAGLSALAFLVLAVFSGNAATLAEGHMVLSDLIFKFAYGQALDAQNIASEESYWHVAKLKSGGFFSVCLCAGRVNRGR